MKAPLTRATRPQALWKATKTTTWMVLPGLIGGYFVSVWLLCLAPSPAIKVFNQSIGPWLGAGFCVGMIGLLMFPACLLASYVQERSRKTQSEIEAAEIRQLRNLQARYPEVKPD